MSLEQRLARVLCRDEPFLRDVLRKIELRRQRSQPVDQLLQRLEHHLQAAEERAAQFRFGLPQPHYRNDLPIHQHRPTLLKALRKHPVLIICGETGSGKTTQLPKLCLEAGRGQRGLIGHTQPRRIAARSVALRIAEELDSELGSLVGFKIRFSDRSSEQTRIRVMTDGILLAELRQDPALRTYDTLIIDEAHERSLNIDWLLGYLKRLRGQRPELQILITSATLDPERLSRFFDNAPILTIPGRTWPVELRYLAAENDLGETLTGLTSSSSTDPLPHQIGTETGTKEEPDLATSVLWGVQECLKKGPGDILVFLPGEREIRDVAKMLRHAQLSDTEILPLYARLSAEEQNRVFHPHSGRRVVLATNVAETALTVPGIRFVVDSGLARISRYSWRSRVQQLRMEPISQASCNQRAGRCGRLGPGLCIRLFTEEDFARRPAFTDPEIVRSNLAAVILQMTELGLGDPRRFPLLDSPDERLIRDGFRLLEELQAVDSRHHLTDLGRKLARLPVDPRLGAMLLAAIPRGVIREVATIAAFIAIQDPRERPVAFRSDADRAHALFQVSGSDFLGILKLWEAWHAARATGGSQSLRRWCREHFLSFLRMREWQDLRSQLLQRLAEDSHDGITVPDPAVAIHQSLLAGLVTHIGRKTDQGEYLGTRNRRFHIHPGSVLKRQRPPWIMAAEIAETTRVWARIVASIEPEWVLEVAPHLLRHEVHDPYFQKRDGRIGARDRISLYGLVLFPQARVNFAHHDPAAARECLIRDGLVAGQLRSRSRGYLENRQRVSEIMEWEHRSRRRDLLIEEELQTFYAERLPPEVVDGPSFEAWARKAERENPDILCISRERLLSEPESLPSAVAFPDHLREGGMELPLSYRFEPGLEEDGVTVTIPLLTLRSLPETLGDWLVPGLLTERITALIRSLPKSLRKSFVPAPEFARAALERIETPGGDLRDALSRSLQAITGTAIPRNAWQMDRLEPHLRMRYRILDAEGNCVVSGRDFPELLRQHGRQADQAIVQLQTGEINREGIVRWNFGDLPETLETEHHGARVRVYPVLIDCGDHVALRTEADPRRVLPCHRRGLRRLFLLAAGKRVRDIQRQLPGIETACLQYAALGTCAELQDLILSTAADEVFLQETPWPRDSTAFTARLQQHAHELSASAMKLGTLAARILAITYDIRKALDRDLPLSRIEAARDVQDQLAHLVGAEFLLVTPRIYRSEIPRYLQAIQYRLERVDRNPDRDRRLRVEIEPLWEPIRNLWLQHAEDEAVQQLRFRLEELRVSLFAQPLGTREKVSVQRLARELGIVQERLLNG